MDTEAANVQENQTVEPSIMNEEIPEDLNDEGLKDMNEEEKPKNISEEKPKDIYEKKQSESNGPSLFENKESLSFDAKPKPDVKPELKREFKPEVTSNLREVREAKENQEDKVSPTKRKEIKNPFKAASSKALHLIYWENTINSGIVLASGLSIIIFTSYYSLINISFALIISLLGLSWVVVTGKKQCQNLLNTKYVNPFERFLVERPIYIERASFEKYLDVCIDCVNFVLQESQKIILVESPSRTFRYVVSLYFLWTILGWFSIHTLASIALILGFSAPVAYKHNKALFDGKLETAHGFLDSHVERATGFLKHHTKGVVEKGRNIAVSKGLVKEE